MMQLLVLTTVLWWAISVLGYFIAYFAFDCDDDWVISTFKQDFVSWIVILIITYLLH